MKQLEEQAFSVDEAHNILTIHFGTASGDPVKDAVLSEWCSEVGTNNEEKRFKPVEEMSDDERKLALREVAQWLFQ